MASFRTSSRTPEMVSFALRFVSSLPRGRNKAGSADIPGGAISGRGQERGQKTDKETDKEPARLAGPGPAR
jgi:hypothetical protein